MLHIQLQGLHVVLSMCRFKRSPLVLCAGFAGLHTSPLPSAVISQRGTLSGAAPKNLYQISNRTWGVTPDLVPPS